MNGYNDRPQFMEGFIALRRGMSGLLYFRRIEIG
jgi:hypothetical protein